MIIDPFLQNEILISKDTFTMLEIGNVAKLENQNRFLILTVVVLGISVVVVSVYYKIEKDNSKPYIFKQAVL